MNNKNYRQRWPVIVVLVLCFFGLGSVSYADELLNMMLEKARYLQADGKRAQSQEAWNKVLLASPNNREALLWLGISAASVGDDLAAKEYQQKLELLGANKKIIAALSNAIQVGQPNEAHLKKARLHSSQKNSEEAVEAYKKVFRGHKPTGYLAFEYYQVLAALPGGWNAAKRGMEELIKVFPNQHLFKYVLAKNLTYRESSRRLGIRQLDKLLGHPTVGNDAQAQLIQAILWLQTTVEDEALLDKYAKKWPGHKKLQKKRKDLDWALHGPDERDLALQQAYQWIENDELSAAENLLNQRLAVMPNDAEVLVALGHLRVKQKHHGEAVSYFEKAIKVNPKNASQWRPALVDATFWGLMKQAEVLIEEESIKEAEIVLRKAMKIRPNEVFVRNALAGVLAKLGRHESAKTMYEEVLANDPDNIDAKFGLVFVWLDLGERDKALALADEVTLVQPERRVAFAYMRAQEFTAQALAATDKQTQQIARAKLEGMLTVAPANPWIRLDLARVYRRQGLISEARSLLDGLLVTHATLPSALYARALLHEAESQHSEGLTVLEKIPEHARSQDVRELQRRLWVKVQVERATEAASQGQIKRGRTILNEVADAVGAEPAYLGILANAWLSLGDDDIALAILRQNKGDDIGLQFLYLTVLFNNGQDAEVAVMIEQLEKQDLTTAQRQSLDRIVVDYAVRRANEARKKGDYVKAYDYLSPMRIRYPDNGDVVVALASLHATVGDDKEAFSHYVDVLLVNPHDISALSGAVGIAMKANDYRVALTLAEKGVEENPESAEALALLGQVAYSMGNVNKAVAYLEQALALEAGQSNGAVDTEYKSPKLQLQRIANNSVQVNQYADQSLQEILSKKKNASEMARSPHYTTARMRRINEQLNKIKVQHAANFKAGMAFRFRSGTNGLDELSNLEIPLEYAFSPAYYGRVKLVVSPVLLDAGNLRASEPAEAKRWGTYALGRAAVSETHSQSDSGLALTLDYDTTNWHFDIGSTPLGFVESTFVGAVEWRPSAGSKQIAVGLKRRSVTDSLLSYAGGEDYATGKTWGGVTETGLNISADYGLDTSGVYGTLVYALVDGKAVASNSKVELNAGFYKYVYDNIHDSVTLGVHVGAMGYRHNLSQFSYGQGGYFSPRRYLSITVPVTWVGSRGMLNYQLAANVGIQSFGEDDADYYPNNPDIQRELEAAAVLDDSILTTYKGNSGLDVAYGLEAMTEYGLSAQLSVGATFALSKAKGYSDFSGLVYASFWRQPQQRQRSPRPLQPYYKRK